MGKPLTQAQKARMAAGREAAQARRKEAASGPDALAALMANPGVAGALAGLIEAAVAARLGTGPTTSTAEPTSEMANLAKALERTLILNASQLPGYKAPLPADEVERRAAAFVEMKALLAEYERAGTPPEYYVGAKCWYAGAMMHPEGKAVGTYLPPVHDFEPTNEQGRRVLAAMHAWIGGPPQDIGKELGEAMRAARAPLIGAAAPAEPPGPVLASTSAKDRVVETRTPFGEKVNFGSTNMPAGAPVTPRPRTDTAPIGPAFVDA